jgi:hypothetical protein
MNILKRAYILLTGFLLALIAATAFLSQEHVLSPVEATYGDQVSAGLYYWALSLGETGSGFTEIAATTDGGIIAAGCNDCYSNEAQNWLIRFRRDGSIAWQRSYEYRFIAIAQTGDGGYVLSIDDGQASNDDDAQLIKIDADGQPVWQRQYGAGYFDVIFDVKPVSSGGFVTAGISLISSGPSEGKGSIWIMRLKDDGSVLWKMNYGNCCDDWAYEVVPTHDNGFIVTGTRNGPAYLLKLNANGSVAWHRLYGEWPVGASTVVQTQDGGFAFGGYHNYQIEPGHSDAAPWVVKVNATGDVEWQKLYETDVSCANGRVRDIRNALDGSLLVYSQVCGTARIMNVAEESGNILWERAYQGTPPWLSNLVQASSFLSIGVQLGDHLNLLKLNNSGDIGDCPLVSQGDLIAADISASVQAETLPVVDSPAVQSTFAKPTVTDTALAPTFLCQDTIILDKTVFLPLCAK